MFTWKLKSQGGVTMSRAVLMGVISALGLTACVFQRAEIASRAQTELVGMSKKGLLSCAGVPVRQERVEDLEFLTFSGGGDTVGGAVATQTSPSTAVAAGKRAQRYCEATFVLKDGVVEKLNYQGRTGGLITKGEQCAFIVENCLKP